VALDDMANRVGDVESLDVAGDYLERGVDRLLKSPAVRDAFTGAWLGHPVHPLLTDLPIGFFTSVSVLDLCCGREARAAADLLTALGLASAVPTVLAGAADWRSTGGRARRVGVAHAAANAAGLACWAASWRARRRDHRVAGVVLGLAGSTAMTVAGMLGGTLAFGDLANSRR
jgi:uncharacterized membrane protein